MDYQKIYNNLIIRAKERTLNSYTERHHIVPRCMGGDNSPGNLVNLTPEEHYVAHQLLVKINPKNHKLAFAAVMMCSNRPTNKLYGWLRRKASTLQSHKMNNGGSPTNGKRWISNGVETMLVEKDEFLMLTNSGHYIAGKRAIIAECGHLVRQRCVLCENKKRKSYTNKKNNFKEIAISLYTEFMNSEHNSVTQFAKEKNTSQPRLTTLWKKYVPEYVENRQQGKRFKS